MVLQSQGASDGPDSDPLVPVGRVLDPWGVRGWIKVEPFGGALDSVLLEAPRWRVLPASTARPGASPAWFEVEQVRRHGATVVAKLSGCLERDAALALKAAEIQVPRSAFRPLPEGEFYWVDLIGCRVANPQGADLGRVTAVVDHGAHPILETDQHALIPFVDAYVLEVDLAQRRIVADWQLDWGR